MAFSADMAHYCFKEMDLSSEKMRPGYGAQTYLLIYTD